MIWSMPLSLSIMPFPSISFGRQRMKISLIGIRNILHVSLTGSVSCGFEEN